MNLGRKIITAVPVGFAADGTVDLRASRRILRFVAGSGVDGAFVLGTTGEFPSLDRAERRALLDAYVEELGDLPMVVHVGAASAHEVLGLIEDARACGVRSVAAITPYYLPTTDAAVLSFFERISGAAGGMDVYAYIFARATGVVVGDDLLARISRLPNLYGAKVSGEPIIRLDGYRAVVPDDFVLLTGADSDLAVVPEHGGAGVISGVASAFPEPFIRLAAALADGDEPAVAAAQQQVDDVVELIAASPARMKATLRMRGVDAGHCRMALEPPSEAVLARLRRAVEAYA
ncbi:dihydrodipicolinate synthase family protein [Rugosimonospora africana]|uniref:4-hydroxy-tetrahydrodipicolinate synthase n=1 Tax=Rugosimonospora africana TaxID=556532 RepID=A0A8J3QU37_9ACTN|nr:dihydrodipicolinate synthase family protein [Rugosimonospora africana]GIH14871.1 4-hydroxy-tetrahydrodipicolinate synthase [Rugosimonospora africana]